jgi:hypothetical protein
VIYELRTSTVRQRSLSEVVKAAGTVSLDVRKDNYGKLEGCWQTKLLRPNWHQSRCVARGRTVLYRTAHTALERFDSVDKQFS